MPVLTQTPFGSRWQSDPRDQVAERNFAIMQQLAALNPARDVAQIEANARLQAADAEGRRSQALAQMQAEMQQRALDAQLQMAQMNPARDIAQIEANARLQAAEAEARRSQAWAQMQADMQQRALDAQMQMAQMQQTGAQSAADADLRRQMQLADYQDPVAPLLRQQLGALPTAGAAGAPGVPGAPQIDTRALLAARGLPMISEYEQMGGAPQELILEELRRTAANVGPDVSAPYGNALPQGPLGWLGAAAMPPFAAARAVLRGVGNAVEGRQERPDELKAQARALRTFYEKSPAAGRSRGYDSATARNLAAKAIREALSGRNLTPDQIEAIVAQAVAD